MFLFVYLTDIFRALDEVSRMDYKWYEMCCILYWKKVCGANGEVRLVL